MLYIFDTIQLFGNLIPNFKECWNSTVTKHLEERAIKTVITECTESFKTITDTIRNAADTRSACQSIRAAHWQAVQGRKCSQGLDAGLRRRSSYSARIVREIEQLLLTHLHAVAPSSLLGEALHYLHGQWPKLIRFLENGNWPLNSNPVENAIRPFVVGRRSWLFADTVGGANLYSLIQTAKANGIEPYHYLVALFKRLPLAQTVDDYEALLPWNIDLESK